MDFNDCITCLQHSGVPEDVMKEIRELKDTVRRQDMRLRKLEERLETLERLDNGLV